PALDVDVNRYRGVLARRVDPPTVALFEAAYRNIADAAVSGGDDPNVARQIDGCCPNAAVDLHVVIVIRFAAQVDTQLADAHVEFERTQVERPEVHLCFTHA